MLIKSRILIYAKIWQFYPDNLRKLYANFFTHLLQTKICKLAHLLYLSNWKNQSCSETLSLDILINGHYLENEKYHVRWKLLHLGPDLKICWFVVTQVCCFEYTRSVLKKIIFFHFLKKIALIQTHSYGSLSSVRHRGWDDVATIHRRGKSMAVLMMP